MRAALFNHESAVALLLVVLVVEAGRTIIDMTHDFANGDTRTWPGNEPYRWTVGSRGEQEGGYYVEANSFCVGEHAGTHLDAPAHFMRNRSRLEKIALDSLIGNAVVVNLTSKVTPDYQCTVEDLQQWESQHGRIPDDSVVLINTGWSRHYLNPKLYFGSRVPDPSQFRFPGLHHQAATWLVNHRQVKMVGIDTMTVDYGQSKTFASHQTLSLNNVPVLEAVANMDLLPATGATVYAIPMKIRDGSGAPARVFAVLNDGMALRKRPRAELLMLVSIVYVTIRTLHV